MSDEQLIAFLEAVKDNPALKEKLMAAADVAAVVAIAKAAGFVIDAGQLKPRQDNKIEDELLEQVAGGGGGGENFNTFPDCSTRIATSCDIKCSTHLWNC